MLAGELLGDFQEILIHTDRDKSSPGFHFRVTEGLQGIFTTLGAASLSQLEIVNDPTEVGPPLWR